METCGQLSGFCLNEGIESIIFGSYALHTDPKSEAILDVCHFEDEMTRDRSPRVQVVWVLEY